MIKPMKAQAVDVLPDGPYIMEPKFDGWRVVAERTSTGVKLYTNTGKSLDSIPYINDALKNLPPGTIVDGEVVDLQGDTQWNRTQTICSRYAAHVPTATDPALSYILFDIIRLGDVELKDWPLNKRRKYLADVFTRYVQSDNVGLAPVWDLSQEKFDALIKLGYEGVVCKHKDSRYVQGARNRGWVKIKPFKEVDALVTGTFPAEAGSKYDGNAVGGITFRITHDNGVTYDGQCAGMADDLRTDLYNNPAAYVGKVVEIAHWGIGKDGALRHPNFRRFRDEADKGAAQLPTPALVRGTPKPKKAAPVLGAAPSGRMRNYKAMGREKLQNALEELRAGRGDAYDRALSGSGDPAADLAVAEDCWRLMNA
jgi:bifunctional non-homologous end joining protein LigD